jgi:hypothetical protein
LGFVDFDSAVSGGKIDKHTFLATDFTDFHWFFGRSAQLIETRGKGFDDSRLNRFVVSNLSRALPREEREAVRGSSEKSCRRLCGFPGRCASPHCASGQASK